MSKKVIKKLNQLRELTGRRQPIEQKLLVDIARHIKQLHPEDIDDKVRLGVVLFYQHLIDENCNELVEAVDRHFSDIAECCSAALIADAHNNVANHVIPFLPTPNRIDVRFGNNPYLLQYHYYMLNDFVGNWTHAIQENTDMLFGLVALRYEGELFLNHLTPINLLMICKEFAYLNDIETIKPLVTWCVASNKREALDHFFVSALALGNVEVVEYLLGQFCDFPRDLTLMLRVLQNSIVVPSSALLEKASKRYDVYALLSAALVKHYDYLALALVSIKMDAGLYAQLTIKQRGRLLELATTCLHQAALKAIFKHTAVQAREALYRQHVLLYIPADYQGPQTSIISAVNLLRYYLDTQQFTFSITEEEQNADSFGLHAFGQLLQILAYALGRKGAHCFGALRSEGRHSKLDVSSNIDSEANLISQLKLLGRVDQDAVLGYRCVVTQNDIDETLPKQVDPDVVK
ncbi:MAG: hypothetical protein KDH94_05330, partial [Coxiellaceae bacterium]|nr:hypothetical protein [Coxiellaceae bacterium]